MLPRRLLPLALAALPVLLACEQVEVVVVDVARVEITPGTVSVPRGQDTQLAARLVASGGEPLAGRDLAWSSDDPLVATTDATGRVLGLAIGTTTIRATSGGAVGTAVVIVTAAAPPDGTPTNVSATALGADRIRVQWSAVADDDDVEEYRVERRMEGGAFVLARTVDEDEQTVEDSGLEPATRYSYRVQACTEDDTCTAYSAEAAAITAALPPTARPGGPYGPVAVGSTITFDGSWSTDPDGSIVSYAWEVADGAGTTLAGVRPTYTCAAGGVYRVRLTVTDNHGATATDSTSAECLAGGPPSQPAAPQLTVLGGTTIRAGWSAPAGGGAVTSYRLERKAPSGGWTTFTFGGAFRSYEDTGLSPGTSYRYRLQACNADGCSPYSNEAVATTSGNGAPAP